MAKVNNNWFLRHKLLSLAILLFSIVALLISAKSYVATYYLRDFFEQHASDIAIEDLTISFLESDFTIKGLETQHQNGQQLNIDSLYVDWQFDGLFDNHITINELKLNGVTLDVQSEEFVPIQIGPLLLSKFKSNETALEENSEPAEPWSLDINNVSLNNLRVCLDDVSLLYAELQLPLVKTQENIGVCLTSESINIAGKFSLNKDQKLAYEDDFTISGLALTTTANESLLTLAKLNLDDINLETEQVTIAQTTLDSLVLLANSSDSKHALVGLKFDELLLNSAQVELDASAIKFSSIQLQNLMLRTQAADMAIRPVAAIQSIELSEFNRDSEALTLNEFTLTNGQFLENYSNSNDTDPYLASLSALNVSEIASNNVSVSINTIELNDLASLITIDDEGLNLTNWFKESSATTAETNEDTPKSDDGSPMLFTLESLRINPSNIRILESLAGEPTEHQLNDITLAIENFSTDSSTDAPTSNIEFRMGIGDNSEFNGEGTFKTITANPEIALNGKLTTLNLVDVSHLATRNIGYRIDRGLLNIDYQVAIKDEKIDAELKTLLEKFALANLEANEQSEMNEDLGLPLPLALDLLRDSDDNIELDLPITGDLNSPDFSVSSIVSVVVVKAIKNAVILNYSPLGMLTMASGILDLATALRFDPVVFEPRSVTLDTQAGEQLDKIIKLMQDKPKVKMVICGVATEVDAPEQQPAQAITPEVMVNSEDELSAQQPVIQPMIDPLVIIEIAQQRQESVIDYIITNGNIDKTRLIGCNIKVAKKKDAKPVVEISI